MHKEIIFLFLAFICHTEFLFSIFAGPSQVARTQASMHPVRLLSICLSFGISLFSYFHVFCCIYSLQEKCYCWNFERLTLNKGNNYTSVSIARLGKNGANERVPSNPNNDAFSFWLTRFSWGTRKPCHPTCFNMLLWPFYLFVILSKRHIVSIKPRLQKPNRWSNWSTLKTGLGPKPRKKPDHKTGPPKYKNYLNFEKLYIYIHVQPCESKPLYTNLQKKCSCVCHTEHISLEPSPLNQLLNFYFF